MQRRWHGKRKTEPRCGLLLGRAAVGRSAPSFCLSSNAKIGRMGHLLIGRHPMVPARDVKPRHRPMRADSGHSRRLASPHVGPPDRRAVMPLWGRVGTLWGVIPPHVRPHVTPHRFRHVHRFRLTAPAALLSGALVSQDSSVAVVVSNIFFYYFNPLHSPATLTSERHWKGEGMPGSRSRWTCRLLWGITWG